MPKQNGCPYQSKNGNACTHKDNYAGKVKKHFCCHSNPLKCRMYNEWVKLKKSHQEL